MSYIIGLAPRLQGITEFLELTMRFEQTGLKQREVGEFVYAAQSWARERRVITRLKYGAQGNNPRYVVTNLKGKSCTMICTASAVRPRTASSRPRSACLPRERVASSCIAISCACCWRH